jgi:phenylalanyl-tRNA synthetase beta chain
MKVAYKHLIDFIPSKPSIQNISNKLFQLGHEHEIYDGVFHMELTPNRGDCLSINGLLRDLAVFFDISPPDEIYDKNINPLMLNFINKAPKACPHISFLKIDIEGNIKPYEGLFYDYFKDLNINKNNFFTDVSNYISYETGQPTHVYDSKKINDVITLEMRNSDYEFKPLTGKNIKLTDENLVFLQGDNKIINLAGVMGGFDTSCSEYTQSVIVECAYFNPETIIGKSLKYDINSDAAYKFERGTDPLCHEKVLRRFIKIVEDHALIKNIEIFREDFTKHNPSQIPFNDEQLNKILGTNIDRKDIEKYLLKLGFKISKNKIISPSHRGDIKTVNDIAEEIARVVGYNNIQSKPLNIPQLTNEEKNYKSLEQNIKYLLIEHGFFEVINNPFVSNRVAQSIKVDNPLDSNREYLRINLENSLIDNLLYNEKRQQDSLKLFEISDVHSSSVKINTKRILGIICSGRVGKNYKNFSKKIDDKYLINIFKNSSYEIIVNPITISRKGLDSKLNSEIIYLEIELDSLKGHGLEKKTNTLKKIDHGNFVKYQPISHFPSSFRDLSFSIKDINGYYELQEYILDYNNDLIKDIFVFDFYFNKLNQEIKLGVRIVFQSKKATITDKQVNYIMKSLQEHVKSIQGVSIPGLS